MALFAPALDVAIAIFVILALAEYVKIRAKASKAFNWIAASGIVALLASASPWISFQGFEWVTGLLTLFFGVVAWFLLLGGAIKGASGLLKSK